MKPSVRAGLRSIIQLADRFSCRASLATATFCSLSWVPATFFQNLRWLQTEKTKYRYIFANSSTIFFGGPPPSKEKVRRTNDRVSRQQRLHEFAFRNVSIRSTLEGTT